MSGEQNTTKERNCCSSEGMSFASMMAEGCGCAEKMARMMGKQQGSGCCADMMATCCGAQRDTENDADKA
jgi:hypothetical protein